MPGVSGMNWPVSGSICPATFAATAAATNFVSSASCFTACCARISSSNFFATGAAASLLRGAGLARTCVGAGRCTAVAAGVGFGGCTALDCTALACRGAVGAGAWAF